MQFKKSSICQVHIYNDKTGAKLQWDIHKKVGINNFHEVTMKAGVKFLSMFFTFCLMRVAYVGYNKLCIGNNGLYLYLNKNHLALIKIDQWTGGWNEHSYSFRTQGLCRVVATG